MNKEEATQISEEVLEQFKKRMKIFSKSEDNYLLNILSASFLRIEQLIGPYKEDDLNFIELVFERSRYAYNDSLEYFEVNFQSYILDYSLQSLVGDNDGNSSEV